MFMLQLHQCEQALAGGRLDEAADVLKNDSVRSHKRGQELLNRLLAALVARGQDHLAHDRVQQAVADCATAEQLGGNHSDVAALQQAIIEALNAKMHHDGRHAAALNTARNHLYEGRFSAAEAELDRLADKLPADHADSTIHRLREQVTARRDDLEHLSERCREAIARTDHALAISLAAQAMQIRSHDRTVQSLVDEVVSSAVATAEQAFGQGRLDQAGRVLDSLAGLKPTSPLYVALSESIKDCRLAAGDVAAGRAGTAAERLRRVRARVDDCTWLDEAIVRLETAEQALRDVRTGALGLMSLSEHVSVRADDWPPAHAVPVPSPVTLQPPKKQAASASSSDALPVCFVLQVDAAGSYLVVLPDICTIGRQDSDTQPHVPLLGSDVVPATIERMDEDYLLRSEQEIAVNEQSVTQALLSDNDRIRLGRRSRMRFRRPVAASATAVLELTGAKLPHSDIRHVILLADAITIAARTNAHVACRQATTNVVLFVRNGALYVRATDTMATDDTITHAVQMNTPVDIGGVRFVVTDTQ